jgi:hypothetical protein
MNVQKHANFVIKKNMQIETPTQVKMGTRSIRLIFHLLPMICLRVWRGGGALEKRRNKWKE